MLQQSDFKFAKIPENLTKESIDEEIQRLKILKVDYKNFDEANKRLFNSIYGVLGYIGFICYDRQIAETVTLQSQDTLKYAIVTFNEYFTDIWNTGEIQKLIGVEKWQPNYDKVVNYADTDSVFAVIQKLYDGCEFEGDFTDFFLAIYNSHLSAYLVDKMRKYVDIFNGFHNKPTGAESFVIEFEQICHTVLWTSKKKYIKVPSWDGHKKIKALDDIVVKGLTINQSSTPKFVREHLRDTVRIILSMGKNIDIYKVIGKLSEIKDQFRTTDIQNICMVERISNWNKYVIDDKKEMIAGSGAKPHIKGAIFHNYKLYQSEYLSKYNPIKDGSRVCWYYTKNSAVASFSFTPYEYPVEINPPEIDLNMQFESMIINPLNTILNAIGIQKLNANLMVETGIW